MSSVYVWEPIDGAHISFEKYVVWAPRQPNNVANKQDCVQLHSKGLNDMHCAKMICVICETQPYYI